MRGYLIHHFTHLYGSVRADLYRNDPYVWSTPYLWSFCHVGQRLNLNKGMTILWLSEVDNTFACDLVFVIDEIVALDEARHRYAKKDAALDHDHFEVGLEAHPECTTTYVANMSRSYIPHPAVPIDDAVDAIRCRQTDSGKEVKPLAISWRTRKPTLRIEAMEELEQTVSTRSRERLTGPLQATDEVTSKTKDHRHP